MVAQIIVIVVVISVHDSEVVAIVMTDLMLLG